MRTVYTKIVENGYIMCIGYSQVDEDFEVQNEITEEEYRRIDEVINNKPEDVEGFLWMLKEDLTWEQKEENEVEE